MDELQQADSADPALDLAQARALLVGGAAALLTAPLAFYARSAAPDPALTPVIAAEGRLYYLGTLLAAAAVGWLATRAAPAARGRRAWIMPALIVFDALWLAGAYHRWPVLAAAPLLVGSGVFATLFMRYLRRGCDGPATAANVGPAANITDMALTIIVGYAAFSVTLLHHSPARYSTPAVGLLGALLCAHWIAAASRRQVAYALIVGLTLAQATWAFSYWQAAGWQLGAATVAIWYGMSAAIAAQLRGSLHRATLLRHGGIAAVVFVVSAALAV